MKDKAWMTQVPFAHRGLHNNEGENVENSMLAFKLAIEKGYGIEFDVHITADKKLVVHHDDHLYRLCGDKRFIKNMALADIQGCKLLKTQQTIPQFYEVLDLIAGKANLVIELKGMGNPTALCELVNQTLKSYKGNYCIESFNPKVISWYNLNAPEVIVGQLASFSERKYPIIGRMLSNLFYDKRTQPDFIAYDINYLPNKYVDNALKRRPTTSVIAWTIKTPAQLEKAQKLCDNYIFEGKGEPKQPAKHND